MLGGDDLILLLTHHCARDTSIFPTEDQRLTLAAIMLLLIYTGCRPAELVDAAKRKATSDPAYKDDNWDSGYDSTDDVQDNDPTYGKALCYEDIRLWFVQNSSLGERDLLAMEITLAHHKGADKKPKPTPFLFHQESLPTLCPISHILALAINDNAIQVDGYTHAQPFFTSQLRDPTKAVLVHWKLEKLKVPIFRQAVRTRTFDGLATSEHKALRYLTFAFYLDHLGWAAGFAQQLTSYCFRRGTWNAVD
ncbi:MAG: hypothetical protein Q9187_008450, partial [Circinaria calcarea]